MNEKATIKSYNIKDQTTIHCHITSKSSSGTTPATTTTTTSSLVSSNDTPEAVPLTQTSQNASPIDLTNDSTTNNPASNPTTRQQPQQIEPVIDMIGLLLNHCILPLLAGLLAGCWYFRINFKHLFSPLTTLVLVIFTFLYALFLFIYIHSHSVYAFNSFFMANRNSIVSNNRQHLNHTNQNHAHTE